MNESSPYFSLPTPARRDAPITSFRDQHQFLSNFAIVPGGITFGNLTGLTVEHLFQAIKARDPLEQQQVLRAVSPVDAKRLGRKVALRPDWEEIKLGVMARLQAAKYRDRDFAARLMATGDAELVEGNHWCDTFYGACSCLRHRGEGQNWLGRILMIQRSVMRF